MNEKMNGLEEYKELYYNLDDLSWKTRLQDYTLITSNFQNQSPKVSIVIANYNNAHYIRKMMDSLINQTIGLEALQILFVDDCSTDNSVEIIKEYQSIYSNIELYVLTKNTGGAFGPRNIGITHLRGEYTVFLDSDDWYDLNALNYLSVFLDKSQDDMIVSGLVQSMDGVLTLKSKAYYVDGDFEHRSIQELPAEFYGWLGPQSIMLRTSIIKENNLHFIRQKVADDVLFFYEALRFSKKISQGIKLTTYLNRNQENKRISGSINREFMHSWHRALGFINNSFPDDVSKERMISRRLEWLIYDFCIRRDIGYKFNKKRLQDFKNQLDYYVGYLSFDPSVYFRSDVRQAIWKYLEKNDINGLYTFLQCQVIRWVCYNKLGMKTIKGDYYYYPQLSKRLPSIRLNAYAVAEQLTKNKVSVRVYSHQQVVGFEVKNNLQPFESRQRLSYRKLEDTLYEVDLPMKFDNERDRFTVVFDNYLEIGIKNIKKII